MYNKKISQSFKLNFNLVDISNLLNKSIDDNDIEEKLINLNLNKKETKGKKE